jgi:hypothetical protein
MTNLKRHRTLTFLLLAAVTMAAILISQLGKRGPSPLGFTALAETQACVTPPSGLVAWYPGDGNANDIQNGLNGTLQNGATLAAGMVGPAFSFDGVDDFVQVPDSPNLNFASNSAITIDLWAFRTGASPRFHFIGKRVGCFPPLDFNYQMASDETNGLSFNSSSGGVFTGVQMPVNTWMHLAASFDGTNYRFYINGQLIKTTAGTFGPTNSAPLEIGKSGTCEVFAGLIDEVEIYNRALSASEIAAIYNAGSAGKCKYGCTPAPTGMVSWYPGDGNSNDIKGGFNGTPENGAAFASGLVGQAFSLDGVDDQVRIPHNSVFNPTGPFSVDVWIKANPQQANNNSLIVDKSHGFTDGTGWGVQTNPNGTIAFFYGIGGGSGDPNNFKGASSTTSVLDDKWHHIGGVFTGTEVQIWVDAVLESTFAITTVPAGNTRDVIIGRSWGGGAPQRPFRGLIDEVEYFNRALAPSEIAAVYNAHTAGKCKPNVCVPPPPNMVSWWPGDGTATDIQGANNGTLQNGATFGAGMVGQAFSFNGSSSDVLVSDAPTLDPAQQITLDAWVFPTADAGPGDVVSMILNKETKNDDIQYEIARKNTGTCTSGGGIATGDFAFFLRGLSLPNDCLGWVDGGAQLPLNTWSHVALTYDGAKVNAYVNGNPTRQITASGLLTTANGSLHIGARSSLANWAGLIDEAEIYNRALTASEIQALYNAGAQGKCKSASVVQFNSAGFNVNEGAGSATINVTRSGDATAYAAVDYATGNGAYIPCAPGSSTPGKATQNCDFIVSVGTLEFNSGQANASISVPIVDDAYVEGAETLPISFSNPVGAILGAQNNATLTIIDNDTTSATSPAPQRFATVLTGAQETPANNSNASGGGLVLLNQAETAAQVGLLFSGLGSNQTGAHIHPGAVGVAGPITFTLANGSPLVDVAISPTGPQVADLKAGLHYMNVHTSNFSNGEIRGQLLWNPSLEASFFTREAYLDFLSREPDQAGGDYWSGQISTCVTNVQCFRDRTTGVSNAFFFELEYQQTGSYVYRLYRAAFGNNQPVPNPDTSNNTERKKIPSYDVFVADRARVVGGAGLAASQLALANLFAQRQGFLAKYPASLSLDQFVDAILATILSDSGANLNSQRTALIALGSRGAVLFRLANDDLQGGNGGINNRAFIDAEYNRAFVTTQYFGYLRRDGDIGGLLFWLGQVSAKPLRDTGVQNAMVCSFITSAEYQLRFGPNVPRTNRECLQ